MKISFKHALLSLLILGGTSASAQGLSLTDETGRASYIMVSKDTLSLAATAGFGSVAVKVSPNNSYTVSKPEADTWLSYRLESNGNLTFFSDYYYDAMNDRTSTVTLTTADGAYSRTIVVEQRHNESANSIGDTKLTIKSGEASSTQSGYPITNAFDGDASTIWHSNWTSGGSFPFTVTLTLSEAQHVDYMLYTPRSDSPNGRWGEISVAYATSAASTTWIEAGTADFGKSSAASTFTFGESGVDNVVKVKITITSAGSNSGGAFASAAEIGFYQYDTSFSSDVSTYFTSPLCSALKDGVTESDVDGMTTPYLKILAKTLLAGGYSTDFRVGTFGAYETRGSVQSRLKTSAPPDKYENPTGIYFEKGTNVVIFAEGIDNSHPVQLLIANFSNASAIDTEGQSDSYYALKNGINVITPTNRGNGYVSYFTDDYENAPNVTLHFALTHEIGYFDQAKGATNAQWKKMLANAKAEGADIIDVLSNRLHVAVPVANASSVCPSNGEKLVLIYDSIIYREREIMGLPQMNIEPKNHQFAKPVASGMFANDLGANASFGSFNEWCNPNNFGFWGMGHELGHNNQITPGFKWSGLGETTNNIYSAWVEHKLGAKNAYGTGYHRLEDENSGIDSYSGWRGGRFEAHLEEGVRKGVSWQLQDGPDYHGTTPDTTSVTGQDANGNSTGSVTTTSRNYDHFLKVVPFHQLTLFTEEVGAAPTSWGRLIQSYRDGFSTATFNTNGKQQVEFMRRMCAATGYNLLPFFEKAGLLKPINAYVEDYNPGWLIINQSMIDALTTEVEAQNYKEAPAALNYINAYNWTRFRDQVALTEGTVGEGCTLNSSANYVKIDNNVWAGAVGYETYKKDGTLLHISMFGLGDDQLSSRYTLALFPANASYIMAVGYDGTKVKCYQR